MGAESKFQQRLKRTLDGVGALTFNVHGHAMQSPGWPDLQVYHRVWTGHLELKINHEPARALQIQRIQALRDRYTNAWIMRYWSDSHFITIDGTSHQLRWKWDGMKMLNWLSDISGEVPGQTRG